MAGVKALIALAFAGCVGLTFLVLGCALVFPPNTTALWWPLFVLVFYFMAPLPLSFAKRYVDDMSGSSAIHEFAVFLTTGIVISAFALPIVLASVASISPWSCVFVILANVVCFSTILVYFTVYDQDEHPYSLCKGNDCTLKGRIYENDCTLKRRIYVRHLYTCVSMLEHGEHSAVLIGDDFSRTKRRRKPPGMVLSPAGFIVILMKLYFSIGAGMLCLLAAYWLSFRLLYMNTQEVIIFLEYAIRNYKTH